MLGCGRSRGGIHAREARHRSSSALSGVDRSTNETTVSGSTGCPLLTRTVVGSVAIRTGGKNICVVIRR
ncbi:hypothetical protein C8Q76DRAFT_740231 [Earliella scabrosa]|nr:hypothetical protein C8Q76DRAFT_740231 [Earliella scabrosa]